ncbi:glycerol-3-phosphate acyltransferas-like protein [Microthyrium microscopicum]|uniref:Glycerol-3-phosphate acyltransferas-like protein n=1 Tax=Microthyrium microscopicum TaxID=703497 RepID=A0A6A6UK46_9PEZI|nr:glycerol-3-phosphate acyltransferas-like protein [Microthyrium microscopicum]
MSKRKQQSETAPDISILGDNATLYPSGYTESQARRNEDKSRTLIDTMARFRSSPLEFFREVSLHVNGTGWRAYDNPIGAPMYFPGFTDRMKEMVMSSTMLQEKITDLSTKRVVVEKKEGLLTGDEAAQEKRYNQLKQSLEEVVDDMLDKMVCKMENKTFIRTQYYLATQLLTRAYHQGIHVSSEEVLKLRAIAQEAQKKKQSIVFLPSHRSHVDYISQQIISYRLGLALPTVVAGENLNFPLVGPFMQHAGAMWIRRSFGNDQLYSTTVQAYIDTLLQNGYNFACFIEGGRSRTGKLLPPKFGILRFIMDSVMSGRVNDAIICPVSTQYDKVIEVDSYITELLGQPKQKENLMDFLNASSILNLKLGRVDVRYHEPWSLKDFIQEQFLRSTDIPGQITEKGKWTNEGRIKVLRTMGYRVLSDINEVSVVMPTALVGTVILTLRGRGVGISELVRRVEWLCERVRDKGGRVAHFANQKTSTVVERALEVLGPAMVGKVPSLPEDTYYAVDRFQLSFYRNMTIHLFILEALTCAGLYTKFKLGGGDENYTMSYTDLKAQVGFLSQLFRGEFIFPTAGLDINLATALSRLEADGVLLLTRTPTAGENSSTTITTIQLAPAERDRGRENYDFYCFLIWPFIEASWLGAISLLMLTPPTNHIGEPWLDATATQDRAQLLGKTLYHQGDLSYFEAVNKETLKNAYLRFEEDGIIVPRKSPNLQIRLAENWAPTRDSEGKLEAKGKLWEFAEQISQSRREGKNRRDAGTVRTRVMGLVDLVGREGWLADGGKKKKAKL